MSDQKNLPKPHPRYGMFYVEQAFRDATELGDVARMQDLRHEYPNLNVNAPDEYGQTPVYLACKKQQPEALDYLLAINEVDVNIPTILGNSALLITSWNDDNEAAAKLLARGADVHARTNASREHHGGVTALDLAKERDNPELVRMLNRVLSQSQQARGSFFDCAREVQETIPTGKGPGLVS